MNIDPQTMQDIGLQDLLALLIKQMAMPEMERKVTKSPGGQFTHYGPRDQPTIPQERLGGLEMLGNLLTTMSGQDLQKELQSSKGDLQKELMGMEIEGKRGLQGEKLDLEQMLHGDEMTMRRDVANINADVYRERNKSEVIKQVKMLLDSAAKYRAMQSDKSLKLAAHYEQQAQEIMNMAGLTMADIPGGGVTPGGGPESAPSNPSGETAGAFSDKNRAATLGNTYGGNLRNPGSVEPQGPPDPTEEEQLLQMLQAAMGRVGR